MIWAEASLRSSSRSLAVNLRPSARPRKKLGSAGITPRKGASATATHSTGFVVKALIVAKTTDSAGGNWLRVNPLGTPRSGSKGS